MSLVLTIARAEARRIFVSPLAWAVLAVVQLILGVFFVMILADYQREAAMSGEGASVADFISRYLFSTANIVLLLVIPLMTMRLFADERKSGSLTLLLASPASLIQIVLGKFGGLLSFLLAQIALLGLMAVTLCVGTHLDLGRIAAGLLGLFLMMSAFGAAGLFVSTLTREPVIAAVTAFGLLLLLWIIGEVAQIESLPHAEAVGYLSLTGHFENLQRGVFSTADVAYYLLFIAFFLWLSVLRLDIERN